MLGLPSLRVLSCGLLLTVLCGCVSRSPVGTDYIGPNQQMSDVCAVYDDDLSSSSWMALQFMEAQDEFVAQPEAVFDQLLGIIKAEPRRPLAFVLSELAYYHISGMETNESRRVKVVPCGAYQTIIREGLVADLTSFEFENEV